jgi:diguanylate cyclase (GGDEF)-like protein/PAS domain S-box-containing protein
VKNLFKKLNQKDDVSIAHALTMRYIIALSLVALLSSSAWFSLQLVISKQKSTAAIVNISGRQRMLSQRTALFSNLLVSSPAAEQPHIRRKLKEAIDLMAHSHDGLIHGNKELGLPASMSPTVSAMYFKCSHPLNTEVETYIKTVQVLLSSDTQLLTADNPSLSYIINTAPTTLVTALDQVVHQYQLEGEASISNLEQIETRLWLVTLLLLMVEAKLIFNPFVRQIKVVINKLQFTAEELKLHQGSLEDKIKVRTSELANRSKELALSEKRLSMILNNTKIHMWAIDGTNYTYINNQWFYFTGQNQCSMLTIAQYNSAVHPDDLAESNKVRLANWETKTEYDHYVRLRRHDGIYRLFYCHASPIFDPSGVFQYFQGYNLDVTERKQMEEQVRQFAFYDPLTKLPNRRLLSDRFSQIMSSSKRSSCYAAMLFLDLDNFKPLNDMHGHVVGDLLLIEVANRLRSCVREIDTVARFGGDEFLVMLSDLDESKAESVLQAGIVAEKIRSALSAPYLLTTKKEGKTVVEHHCSASIGVVVFKHDEGSEEDILKWSDDAMYQAKLAGRNQVCFYENKA